MSTRCNITFAGKHHADAGVFRFVNGDPENVTGDLARFFAEVEAVNAAAAARPGDTRFAHPEYLAVRYIIWQARQWAAEDSADPLTVIGLGVPAEDSDMISWNYRVACDDPLEWPRVSYQEPGRRTRYTCDPAALRDRVAVPGAAQAGTERRIAYLRSRDCHGEREGTEGCESAGECPTCYGEAGEELARLAGRAKTPEPAGDDPAANYEHGY